MTKRFFHLLLLSAILSVSTAALAAEIYPTAKTEPELRIEITPYFWLSSMDVDSTLSGQKTSLVMNFRETLDSFDVVAFSGRIEMFYGDFGFIFDGSTSSLETREVIYASANLPVSLKMDVMLSQQILDFMLAYRALNIPLAQGSDMGFSFDVYGGLRYNLLRQEVLLELDVGPYSRGAKLGGTRCWAEPVLGGRLLFAATDWLSFFARGNISGFGIEGLSMSWTTISGIDVRPVSWTSIKLGWKWYGMDYEQGSGANKFSYEGILNGPWVGWSFYL